MNIEHTIKEQLSTEVELSDAELATVQGGLCPDLLLPGALALCPADLVNVSAHVAVVVPGVLNVGACAHACVL